MNNENLNLYWLSISIHSIFNCVLKADEDAAGDTDDEDEAEDNKRGNKDQNEKAIIILRISGI